MKRRHCLLYAVVSFLSFNITLILSMLFYSPRSLQTRRRYDYLMSVADDDTRRRTADSAEDVDTDAAGGPVKAAAAGPAPRRPPNRHVTEYDPDVSRRVETLARRRATSRDPQLIALARDVIDAPPTNDAGYKMFKVPETPQAIEVDQLLQRMEGGFFVECGGLDGERLSNTAFLERQRGWEGLLIEMDPFFYTQLLGKNRRVWSINACLSPYNYFTTLPYAGDTRGRGQLIIDKLDKDDDDDDDNGRNNNNRRRQRTLTVPCFPLETILAALNRTHVDYFSLDIEGLELQVLETVDWTRVAISVLSVEFNRGKTDKAAYTDYMESNGYRTVKELHNGQFYAHDYIFVADELYSNLVKSRRSLAVGDEPINANVQNA